MIACLGPGTGLGNVYAVWDSGLGRRQVLPSEGCMGHFVARTQVQWDLLQHVAATEGFVPVDRMLGGQGIASWYSFLSTEAGALHRPADMQVDAVVDAEFTASTQPAGVVAAHGTDGEPGADPLCVLALDCFLDTLGQEAANMAMRFLSRGGIYIAGGGIAAKLKDRIMDGRVLAAYLDQGHGGVAQHSSRDRADSHSAVDQKPNGIGTLSAFRLTAGHGSDSCSHKRYIRSYPRERCGGGCLCAYLNLQFAAGSEASAPSAVVLPRFTKAISVAVCANGASPPNGFNQQSW